MWFQNGKLKRKAAPTDWNAALAKAKELEASFASPANGDCHSLDAPVAATEVAPARVAATVAPSQSSDINLHDAIELFLANKAEATNKLTGETLSQKHVEDKLRPMLEGFERFCISRKLVYLSDIKPVHCMAWRRELKQRNGSDYWPSSKAKLTHYLAGFWNFCVRNFDLKKSPVTEDVLLKSPDSQEPKALEPPQQAQLFATINKAVAELKADGQEDEITFKLPALLLLMYRTGLSLRDAVLLPRTAMRPNGNPKFWLVKTARAKTNKDVYALIPAEVAEKVLAGANPSGEYLFVDAVPEGERQLDTFIKKWGDRIGKLGEQANIRDENGEQLFPTSHWARHSFVRFCLNHGISTENVAMMLGDSLSVVAKHYSGWIEGAQDRLNDTMKEAYEAEEKKAQAATVGR